jgi:hypothetical protein
MAFIRFRAKQVQRGRLTFLQVRTSSNGGSAEIAGRETAAADAQRNGHCPVGPRMVGPRRGTDAWDGIGG